MKTKEADGRQLVERLRSRDPEAIDELVDQYSKPLFGVILNYTKNPSDAEEILQDTLLKIIHKIDTFREESDVWPWMRRIAINNGIMWLRKHRTRNERTTSLDELLPDFSREGEFAVPVYGWTVDPEEVYLNSELAGELYEAVQLLPFEYRIPLVLKDIEGYSIKQISSLLGLKEPTTKTRIHRARLVVRQKLADYFENRGQ
ncbi:MAG TPA: sigma-70 family RNA polymerase sigma factor [Acidobacteriota bacterium]|nr:sigma-70 family RNA polymerase sigma factor [Acidobacteriota bacterium]